MTRHERAAHTPRPQCVSESATDDCVRALAETPSETDGRSDEVRGYESERRREGWL